MTSLGLVLSLVALLQPPAMRAPVPDRQLLVFAAASLSESMVELGDAFEKRSGTKVSFSFGASSDLEKQIEAGAPADVFFSADTARMDLLEKAGLVRTADRREFLSNVLVVAVPANSTARVASAKDLAALPRIALADPLAVPAGIYAKHWLTSAGVWGLIAPKVVPMLDVRAALASVAGGDIPAAVVYATDVAAGKGTRVAMTVGDGPPIAYSLAALHGSKNFASAEDFVRFVAGAEGRAVFVRRGFRVLP